MTDAWSVVLQRHLASLEPLQQQSLKATASASACLDVVRLARGRRKGYDRLLSALQGLIEPIRRFEGVIDVIIQVNSGIASPVWGPLKLALGLASERLTTLQNITALLERLVEPLARFQNYEALFYSNAAVHRSICNLYTHLIGFCASIIRYHSQSSLRNILGSFDKEFRDASEAIRHCWTEVDIAANAANIEEAQLARAAEASHKIAQIRVDLVRWLGPSSVQDDLEVQSSNYMTNSCDWMRDWPQYRWFIEPGRTNTLTILGSPGQGKTYLTTFVVKSLLKANKAQVLYFFCKAGDPEKRTTLQVLRTLLAQLLRSKVVSPEIVEEIYYNNGHEVAESLFEVRAAFELALQACQLPDLYIVVDGLDECEQNLDLIRILLGFLNNLATSRKAVHLLLSTREHVDIVRELEQNSVLARLDTRSQAAGLHAYTIQRVFSMRILFGTGLQESIVDEVCNASEGLWLYARLMLDEIQHLPNVAMIRRQLQNIPRGLKQLYTQILNTLATNNDEWQSQVAQQIFLWIDMDDFMLVGSADNLSLAVLEIALQHISMGEPVHDPVSLVHKLGAHMVNVFEEDHSFAVVSFNHYTAQQYIRWSSTAPYTQIPAILKPRRLRELYCAVTAAWYLSHHHQAKANCSDLRRNRGRGLTGQYFHMAYALWGAFKLKILPSPLDEEELHTITELCNQLNHFLTSDQCLIWVEMAILINYSGGFSLLLDNVEDTIAASSNLHTSKHAAFETFRQTRHTFFTDYAYVISATGPFEARINIYDQERVHTIPDGFCGRPTACKLMKLGREYAGLYQELHPGRRAERLSNHVERVLQAIKQRPDPDHKTQGSGQRAQLGNFAYRGPKDTE